MMRRLLCVLAVLVPVTSVSAQQYRDSYPRDSDIDMLGYVFNLTFLDDSDLISGVATATARCSSAGPAQLRLDLVKRSDELAGKGKE